MPAPIDPAEFGFHNRHELASATAGMLAHLARIGITHLPAAAKLPDRGSLSLTIDPPPEPDSPARHAPPPHHLPPRDAAAEARPATAEGVTADRAAPAGRPAAGRPAAGRPAVVREPTAAAPIGRHGGAPTINDGPTRYAGPSLPLAERQAALSAAAARVSVCTRCPELVRSRRQTVFGEGSATPRVCFFGEAPGAEEDRTGRPFVGKAGQLLTKMIEACTFRREDVYILNTIKCRPPGNRNPQLEEVENCREYFELQLEVLQPEYIVCLGVVAARALLHTTASVGRLRGAFHRYRASKVVVTYHPAYLLRNPEAKRAAWEDLQLMLRDMGVDPKKQR